MIAAGPGVEDARDPSAPTARWPGARRRYRRTAFLLVSSYAFGAVVLGHDLIAGFAYLTAAHLCGTAALMLWHHRGAARTARRRDRLLTWAAVCGLLGWWAEYIGVHFGFLFGSYRYGDVLGPAWHAIPLVMAVNWIVVVYAVCATLNRYAAGVHVVLRVGLAALAMVALDVLIEPVAIALDFWTWDLGHPPLRNYLGWLGVGVVQGGLFYAIVPYASNRLAPLALALQVLFFAYLSLVLPG